MIKFQEGAREKRFFLALFLLPEKYVNRLHPKGKLIKIAKSMSIELYF